MTLIQDDKEVITRTMTKMELRKRRHCEDPKIVIYEAFVEGRLEAPEHPARNVHDL